MDRDKNRIFHSATSDMIHLSSNSSVES